jgi:ABC-type glycerol-3-phosphate transport system substrate-binding protein
MKRLISLVVSALVAGAAITSCGGGSDSPAATATADKLTIVGAGS